MPSDNDWGIPSIRGEVLPPSFQLDWNLAYDDWRTLRNKKQPKPEGKGFVHFFSDDYRFESAWNQPIKAFVYLDGADIVLSPDFSLFRDHPPAIWLWNVYRSRWLGAYWQSQGLSVVPTVGWSEPSSYNYCFLGLPVGATLAVATIGMGVDTHAWHLFAMGYREMCNRLAPARVLCYGESLPLALRQLAPVDVFKPWHLSRLRKLDERSKPIVT
jgi:hypothetical protein